MAAKSRIPVAAVGIGLLALGAAVVVLVAGGPDRWAVVAGLLVFVLFAIAAGGALDEAWRSLPRTTPSASAPLGEDGRPPRSVATRASFALATVLGLIPVVVAAALAGLAVKAWVDGDAVKGSLSVVFAGVFAWRGWRSLRRLTGRD
ncbi:hypothetical protein [Paractinoplanes globisporus]|uniref:Integral membrane protein n=1 Tax=Paractinoplanes globisporus TaxID=113565 RepID=A0ABW6WPM0_9ACTN|nr:hypothetical protein [Actinoplanes globisporus]